MRTEIEAINVRTRQLEEVMRQYPNMTLTEAKQFAALNAEQLFNAADCQGCDGYVLHPSEAPFCPSCSREKAGK